MKQCTSILSTEAILEGLAAELRRIVEEREAKNVPASQQELDELDLKLRSLRTQLRKAEEASTQLAKQKKELEEKMTKNTKDVSQVEPNYVYPFVRFMILIECFYFVLHVTCPESDWKLSL